jgi:hypothetical protein
VVPGRNAADERLSRLGKRLDVLEEREERAPALKSRRFTDAEIVEICLIRLRYFHSGDIGSYAEQIAEESDVPYEEALETATTLAALLEEWPRPL